MSYLKLSETTGASVGAGQKFSKGVPFIRVSKYGSPRSNGPSNTKTSWFERYRNKNTRRFAMRLSRNG